MKDIIVNERYRVDCKISNGGFGLVYSGTDLISDDEVAMKLVHARDRPNIDMLGAEADAYKDLSGGVGIPRVRWSGRDGDYHVIVLDALGPSLEDLLNYCDRRLSLKTVLLVADQALSRIEYVHSKGYLHRDIKPSNFLMGVGRKGNVLYTIDFGLAKEFREAERDRRRKDRAFGGTSRYASLNNHRGHEQSWGDDLESLGYALLYLARGSLPWQGLTASTCEDKNKLIKQKKLNLPVEALCEGLPVEFAAYINYTRSLGFDDRPDYAYLRRMFRSLFRSSGFKHDNVFDWTEKLFNETYGRAYTPRPETKGGRVNKRASGNVSMGGGSSHGRRGRARKGRR